MDRVQLVLHYLISFYSFIRFICASNAMKMCSMANMEDESTVKNRKKGQNDV